ncbi:hypothetical protein, conserved [Eimeria tenella]|uniref:Uncharacterized protein n=1 Tax=Eimeria tenella TaxID=5802 RepID=U6KQ01_EIMTE|nr:hypothetical protein, conserved [Eimeria tenella]CDJ38337.1 hypothetical protein, conserved [Eimeria tenella]|eukprot:XP_013229175.1 hypothetical protein, conserved [Eimeria tenella]
MLLSRALRGRVPVPQFSRDRFFRRPNMLEADRARLYYFNLFSIAATAVPIWYMMTVNYRFCEESVMLSDSLGSSGVSPTDLGLFYPHKLQK